MKSLTHTLPSKGTGAIDKPASLPPVSSTPTSSSAPTAPAHDYAELKRRVKAAGLFEKQPHYYVWNMVLTISAFLASMSLLFLVHSLWFQIVNAILLAVIFAQMGFLGHDAGHWQPFAASWKNKLAGLLFGNLLLGMSRSWWVEKHNQHHSHPNQLDMDPDLNIPGICFNTSDAQNRQGFERWIMRHQVWLFFPMLLLVALDLSRSSILFLSENRKRRDSDFWLECVLILVHWLALTLILVSSLGVWQALLFFAINQAITGFILGSAFAPNHKGMPVVEKESKLSFLQRQILTSRNIRGGIFTDFWYGGLNYQIEHHLFPTMPRKNLCAAQVFVKQFCQERNIPYVETSIPGAYGALLHVLSEISTLA